MAKPKQESSSKSTKKTESAGRSKGTSSPRVFRKSPARTEKNKSPSRTARTPSPTKSSKSPARKSPKKSPARNKSPSRKSPSRKSPARKSPTRRESDSAPKLRGRTKVQSKVTATRSQKEIVELDSDSDTLEFSHSANTEKPKAAVRGRARGIESGDSFPKNIQSIKEPAHVEKVSSYISLVRRPVHKSSHSREIDRIVHLKDNDSAVLKRTEFSDEDDVPPLRASSVKEKSEPKVTDEKIKKIAILGWIGALVAIPLMPLCFITFNALCDEKQCSFTKFPNLQKYKHVSTYINNVAILGYSAYALLIAILSALPFGGSKVLGMLTKQGRLDYRLNGAFCLLFTCLIVIGLEYFKVPVASFILNKYFQLLITSAIVGILLSVYLYVRSFFVPISALAPNALSSSRIYNFWIGRELNPRILFNRLDVKLYLMRLMIISVVIFNAILIYKNIGLPKTSELKNTLDYIQLINYNPTLLVIAVLQIIYAVDFFVHESTYLTSFQVQYEPVGYLYGCGFPAGVFVFPTTISKYVYDHGVRLPAWELIAAVFIYAVGIFLYRASNLQKHTFRQNPYSPTVANLETIPTSQGKKLIVSSYWGFVRHPNYLGDILMWLSFALFVLNTPVVTICIIDILVLIIRCHIDGQNCKKRYGTAWDRYCQRVKYVLIPKIY